MAQRAVRQRRLPRDPELLRALLEQARDDPEMVKTRDRGQGQDGQRYLHTPCQR